MDDDGKHRTLVGALGALALSLSALPATGESCRLALLLALDVSSSVDVSEYRLQREGVARALEAPEVRAAFLGGRPVALSVFEWGGAGAQYVLLDWTVITGSSDIDHAAERVRSARRKAMRSLTGLGDALLFAESHFQDGPICDRKTLDVSGDGITNDGPTVAEAYGERGFSEITVNGLPIGGAEGWSDEGSALRYYFDEVIRGSGAFVEPADDYADFARAMRRKLFRELGAGALSNRALSGEATHP